MFFSATVSHSHWRLSGKCRNIKEKSHPYFPCPKMTTVHTFQRNIIVPFEKMILSRNTKKKKTVQIEMTVFINVFFKLFYCCSITVVCICPTPLPPPNASHPHFPPLLPSPLGFVHVSFIVVPGNPPHLPPVIPSHLPSGYCQIVINFNVSGYILLACLFCWLGST